MMRSILFISLNIFFLNVAFSQAKWITGLPKGFYENHIAACGPYHFIADWDVLYRNTPDFKGWERVNLNIGGKNIWSIHGYGNRLIICSEPGNIRYSDDFGETFITAGQGAGSEPPGQFFQTNDSIVYFQGEKRFSVSYDGGKNFASRLTYNSGGASAYYKNHGIYIDQTTPGPRVIISTDHFRTFETTYATAIRTGKPSCMAVLDSTFFVGTVGSPNIYFTKDFGYTWDSVMTNTAVNAFYKLTRDDNGMWAATNAGVLRSNNDGTIWTLKPYDQLGGWPKGEPVTSDVFVKGDTIYASLYKCLLLRSIDGGNNWDVHQDGIYGGALFRLYDDGIHLSMGTNEGQFIASPPDFKLQPRRSLLFEQYDVGSWQFRDWLIDDGVQFNFWIGVYTSLDQGMTFEQVSTSTAWSLMEHQDTIWFGAYRTVYYSPDNGITWKPFRNFGSKLPEDIRAVYRNHGVLTIYVGDVLSDGYIYSVNGFGINPELEFQSDDYNLTEGLAGGDSVVVADGFSRGIPISIDSGRTWNFIEHPLGIYSAVNEVAYLNGIVIAATSKGVWAYGVNSGVWIEVDPQIFSGKDIVSATTYKGNFYVATYNEGVYQLDINTIDCLLDPLRSDCAKISGAMFFTTSDTCAQDSNALPMFGQLVEILPGPNYAFVHPNGNFLMPVEPGMYTVRPVLYDSIFYELICPPAGYYDVDINASDQVADSLFFYFRPGPPVEELSIDVVCQSIFRLTRPVRFSITCRNNGNTYLEPFVVFNFPGSMDLINSTIPPDFSNDTRLEWTLDTLAPLGRIQFYVDFMINGVQADIGDTLDIIGEVYPIDEDVLPKNNSDSLYLVIVGAVDPNDKLVDPAGEGVSGIIPRSTDAFEYTIRFQNTGTDTAFAVTLIDTLDEIFELSTIQYLSSHPANANAVLQQNILKVDFPDILLPDSNVNYLGSQGYFKFSIKTKEPLREGEQIKNQAHIVFDQQEALATNVAINTVEIISSVTHEDEIKSLQVFPNPTSGTIYGKIEKLIPGCEFMLYDILGRNVGIEFLDFENGIFKIEVPDDIEDGVYGLSYSCKGQATKMNLVVIRKIR